MNVKIPVFCLRLNEFVIFLQQRIIIIYYETSVQIQNKANGEAAGHAVSILQLYSFHIQLGGLTERSRHIRKQRKL